MQADYLAISKAFHTVFITGVPQLNVNTLPQARRLILLIDALYEHRVMVMFSAAKVPTELFDKSDVGCVQSEQTNERLFAVPVSDENPMICQDRLGRVKQKVSTKIWMGLAASAEESRMRHLLLIERSAGSSRCRARSIYRRSTPPSLLLPPPRQQQQQQQQQQQRRPMMEGQFRRKRQRERHF